MPHSLCRQLTTKLQITFLFFLSQNECSFPEVTFYAFVFTCKSDTRITVDVILDMHHASILC